jgi:hypothetical protein
MSIVLPLPRIDQNIDQNIDQIIIPVIILSSLILWMAFCVCYLRIDTASAIYILLPRENFTIPRGLASDPFRGSMKPELW